MLKLKNVDATKGNLLKSILIYAFPLILIDLVQKLFNSVDIIVLGQFADTTAVASIGATTTILHLILNIFFGLSAGSRIVLARLVGAQEEEKVKQTVSTSLITALALGVITALLGLFLAEPFLMLTNCPAECFEGAKLYIQCYIVAAPAIMLYHFGTAILNVSGDTQRPLVYMLLAGILNAVLNIILCMILPQKVVAVAVATAASQVLSASLVLRRVCTMDGICKFNFRELSWSGYSFKRIMQNGLPVGLTSALFPLSNLQIQSQINSFGTTFMAGNTAMTNIESLASSVSSASFPVATGVFVGQNLGAEKTDRVKQSIRYGLLITVGIGLFLAVTSIWYTRPLASLYVAGDAAAIEAAMIRRKYILGIYFVSCFNGVTGQILQNFGYSFFTTWSNIVAVFLFRFFWTWVVFPQYGTYDCTCLCFTVSWCLIALFHALFLIYVYQFKFKKGKLKRI